MAGYWMFEEDRQFARRWAKSDPEATRRHLALPMNERLAKSEMLSRMGCIAYHPSREPDELQFYVKAKALGLYRG